MTRRRRKKYAGGSEAWSNTQRLEAVSIHLATGSPTSTSLATGIPLQTLYKWKRSDWWKKAVEEYRAEENLRTDATLSKIVEKSLEVVSDRLDNGDFQFDQKTSQLIRKPVSARDAHKISMDVIDKRSVIQNAEKQETDQKKTEDRLFKLAEEFVKFSRSKDITAVKTTYTEITDGET